MAIRGGFEIATAYVDLILDKDHAKQGVRELPRDLNPDADRAGRDTGNVISRGIRLSIVRNSPLIAAAIAGGLAAGAPLLLGAATVLMGGVAAVAAAQSQKVRSAWVGAWDEIKRGAIEDARILEPTFVRAAGTIAAAFQQMRPAMRDAFADLGPQIDVLVGSLARFAQSFTGGLMVAIRNGAPVIEGLGKAIESIGVGFEDAMTRMAAHSAAAGDVWAQLGDILSTLLSLFGELMGTGVEIAHIMLPALGGSLKVVLAVLELLGPLLPAIVTGFSAFKIAQTAARWVDTFAASLGKVSKGGGAFAAAAGKGQTALVGFGRAIPLIAATMAAFAVTTAQNEDRIKSWSQTLIKGGAGADALRDKAAGAKDKLFDLTSGDWWKSTFLLGDLWDDSAASNIVDDFDAASAAAKEYLANLTPMARLQQEVTWAQEALDVALEKFGPGSAQAARAQEELDRASAAVTRQLEMEEAQLHGVTQAMIDMADQANARANSSLAYRQSLLDTSDAVANLAKVQADSTSSATDIARANLDVEDSYIRQAEAAGKLATDALPATMDANEKAAFAARASLTELDALKAKYGELPPALEIYRQSLERTAAGMDETKLNSDALVATFEGLGMTVNQIPDTKDIRITAPTEEVVQKLKDLGFTVTDIPGTKDVLVSADTDEAKGNVADLGAALVGLNGTEAHPLVIADDRASGIIDQLFGDLWNLDGTTVSPDAELGGTGDFLTDLGNLTNGILGLDAQHAEPDATLNTTIPTQTDADIADLFGLGGTVATPQASLNTTIPGQVGNDIGLLGSLAGQRPTPTANLANGPFASMFAAIMGQIRVLGSQRPAPTPLINTGPFSSSFAGVMGQLGVINAQRPSPTATLRADTAAAEAAINYAARTRTAYIRTVTQKALAGGGPVDGRGPIRAATGTKVRGAGGPFDDLVRALGPGGSDYRLSAGEWIVNALASSQYGDAAMRALNAGTAIVTLPEDQPRSHGATWMGDASGRGAVSVTPTANGATVSVGQLHVHIQGVFDLTKPMEMRRLGQRLREVLIQLDREHA